MRSSCLHAGTECTLKDDKMKAEKMEKKAGICNEVYNEYYIHRQGIQTSASSAGHFHSCSHLNKLYEFTWGKFCLGWTCISPTCKASFFLLHWKERSVPFTLASLFFICEHPLLLTFSGFLYRGWQGLIAQGCHSSILIIDPKTSQTIQVLEKHKANVVKVSHLNSFYSFVCAKMFITVSYKKKKII